MTIIWTLWVIFFIIIDTLWCGPAAAIAGIFSRTKKLPYRMAQLWARLLIRAAGVKVETTGLENLDPAKPYIFVPNHMSHFDAPCIVVNLPHQIRFIGKKSLAYIPIFGWGILAIGTIIIDRSNHKKAVASMDRAAEVVRAGTSVLIFAEGYRSRDGKLGAFKKGAFIMAIKSGVEIVPIRVSGSIKVHRRGSFAVHPGTVKVRFGKPIDPRPYTMETKEALMEAVRRSIKEE